MPDQNNNEDSAECRGELGKPLATLSDEQKQQLQQLNRAYVEYAERIDRWIKANGNTPPPFRWDQDLGEFIWVNRKERRKWK